MRKAAPSQAPTPTSPGPQLFPPHLDSPTDSLEPAGVQWQSLLVAQQEWPLILWSPGSDGRSGTEQVPQDAHGIEF